MKKKSIKLVSMIILFVVVISVFIYVWNTTIMPMIHYNKGCSLFDKGDYSAAIEAFTKVGDDEEAEYMIHRSYYEKGKELMLVEEDYSAAIKAFLYVSNYSDTSRKIDVSYHLNQAYYYFGKEMLDEGDYVAAIKAFTNAKDYSDSLDYLSQAYYEQGCVLLEAGDYIEAIKAFEGARTDEAKKQIENAEMLLLQNTNVGDVVYYGNYEQDNNWENGTEAIEWIVLEKENSKFYTNILLISKYCLDVQPYHTRNEDTKWYYCTLRRWLNSDFYNYTFSDEEKNKMGSIDSDVLGSRWSTYDKVSLLSVSEVEKYFPYNSEKKVVATEYAKARAESISGQSYNWWLRSQGSYENTAAYVQYSGGYLEVNNGFTIEHAEGAEVRADGSSVDEFYGVRPAIKIQIPLVNGE